MTKEKLVVEKQLELTKRLGIAFSECPLNLKLGLSKTVFSIKEPLHGLRHSIEGDTVGWYIWAGEYSDSPDFFEPVHVEHLITKLPIVMPYLGLPPGWRFLIDYEGYEDVWEDPDLLVID